MDEAAPELEAWAVTGLGWFVVAVGAGLGRVAARLIAAIAALAAGADWPGRAPAMEMLESLSANLEGADCDAWEGTGLSIGAADWEAQGCCWGKRCSGQKSLRQELQRMGAMRTLPHLELAHRGAWDLAARLLPMTGQSFMM